MRNQFIGAYLPKEVADKFTAVVKHFNAPSESWFVKELIRLAILDMENADNRTYKPSFEFNRGKELFNQFNK
jgi:hypothetical protein